MCRLPFGVTQQQLSLWLSLSCGEMQGCWNDRWFRPPTRRYNVYLVRLWREDYLLCVVAKCHDDALRLQCIRVASPPSLALRISWPPASVAVEGHNFTVTYVVVVGTCALKEAMAAHCHGELTAWPLWDWTAPDIIVT
jgi:hypothetical protein